MPKSASNAFHEGRIPTLGQVHDNKFSCSRCGKELSLLNSQSGIDGALCSGCVDWDRPAKDGDFYALPKKVKP